MGETQDKFSIWWPRLFYADIIKSLERFKILNNIQFLGDRSTEWYIDLKYSKKNRKLRGTTKRILNE